MDLQHKFERELEAAIERTNPNLEVINNRRFSNVGVIQIMPTDQFVPIATVRYEFYDTSLTLRVNPPIEGWRRQEGDESVVYINLEPRHGSPGDLSLLSFVIDSVCQTAAEY